jgi:hypothetical protein
VVHVERSFADNRHDRRFSDLQFPAGADTERKRRVCPTENSFEKLTPFPFRRYLSYDYAGIVPGHICTRNVEVAVCFEGETSLLLTFTETESCFIAGRMKS